MAERIAQRLAARGLEFRLHDLSTAPVMADLPDMSPVVVVAAVRYGRHLPEAERFFAACQGSAAPLVLLSVNLTARKPGKRGEGGNRYLRSAVARFGLKPALAAAIAGRLDYPRYGWLDRQVIRLIMAMTGGPTDPRACIEFTDWAAVDAIADQIGVYFNDV